MELIEKVKNQAEIRKRKDVKPQVILQKPGELQPGFLLEPAFSSPWCTSVFLRVVSKFQTFAANPFEVA
jgi:hypothetical protein